MWRVALGVKQAEHPDQSHLTLVDRQDLEIVDQVTAGYHAAPLTFEVESPNFLLPFEPIFTNCEQRLRKIKLVCVVAAVEIDVEPVTRREVGTAHTKALRHRYPASVLPLGLLDGVIIGGVSGSGQGVMCRLLGKGGDAGRMEAVLPRWSRYRQRLRIRR